MSHCKKLRKGRGWAKTKMNAFDACYIARFGTDRNTWPIWAHSDISREQAFIDKGNVKIESMVKRYDQIMGKTGYRYMNQYTLPVRNFGVLPKSIR